MPPSAPSVRLAAAAGAALVAALAAAALVLAADSSPRGALAAPVPPPESRPQTFPSPAPADTQCAHLAAGPDGTIHLTYYGPAPAGAPAGARTLWLATLAAGAAHWSAPRPIVTTPLLLENWADFATLVVGTDGALTAQWFQQAAPDARGYDGWYSRSEDGGRTWREPARLGHEFVALAPLSGGRNLAVWLESARVRAPAAAAPRPKRDPAAPCPARDPHAPYAPTMKLLARLLAPDGATLGAWTVDPDVCSCCQNTAAVLPGDRIFVGYRGHDREEIRDNRYTIFDLATRTWSPPAALRDDGWKIPACPVNGPAADARGDALAVSWFTAAGGTPRVQARYSADAGRTLGAPVVIDLGRPMGRLDTVMLPDRTALVTWLELGSAENVAGLYTRRLFPDGALSAPLLLTATSQARASGFPRAVPLPDGRILVAWTQAGEPNRVQLLALAPSALARPAAGTASFAPPARRGPPVNPEFCAPPATTHGASP